MLTKTRALNAKKEDKAWGPDQTKNHHPALINILAETMKVEGNLIRVVSICTFI